jgi:hypothetical protein
VFESIQAMSLLTIVGPVLLLAVLIYGTLQWSRRRRGPTQVVREESTRELYREGARAEEREEAGKASAGEKPPPNGRASDRSAMAGLFMSLVQIRPMRSWHCRLGRMKSETPPGDQRGLVFAVERGDVLLNNGTNECAPH